MGRAAGRKLAAVVFLWPPHDAVLSSRRRARAEAAGMITADDRTRVAMLFERLVQTQFITKAIFQELQQIFEHSGGFDHRWACWQICWAHAQTQLCFSLAQSLILPR